MRLSSKVALVTGARRGIGRSIAMALTEAGADVAVCDVVEDDGELKEVQAEIENLGRKAICIRADVTVKAEVEGMVKKVIAEFGQLDILVNNAGMPIVGASADLEESRWRFGLDVMLTGVFFCSQAAGQEMIKRKYGKIITISSVAGLGAFPERASYCSAKAGVINLTRVLGCEWARYNINVNSVAPGYVKTAQIEKLIQEGKYDEAALTARTPMGKLGTGEDVANAVVFLSSEEASYINGQTLVVDGGWSSYMYLESWLQDR